MSSAHVIQMASPKVFKSRLKGQVACYACISFADDSSSQQFDDGSSITDLYQTLGKVKGKDLTVIYSILIITHKLAASFFF